MTNEQFSKPYVYQRDGKWCCGYRIQIPIRHREGATPVTAYLYFIASVNRYQAEQANAIFRNHHEPQKNELERRRKLSLLQMFANLFPG